ncbi:MAG: HAMP domain-containing sensor histidine kinase [Cyanobacteria bacterium P01_E01_bin.45]
MTYSINNSKSPSRELDTIVTGRFVQGKQESTLSVAEQEIAAESLEVSRPSYRSITHRRSAQIKQLLSFEELLKNITDSVRDTLDETTILETTVRELCLALNVRCCNASLYNLADRTSTVRYEYAAAVPGSRGRVSQMEDFPECYQQLLDKWCFQMCSLRVSPERQQVALLACAIYNGESSLGDLWLVDRADREFSELEIRLVKQVANQCAIAIRQARLYQTSQNQVHQLQQMHQIKDDFISTVSHELRTPLTSIKMALTMLKNQLSEPQKQKYLAMALQQCQREIDLVNDLLDLQKLEQADRTFIRNSAVSVSLPLWLGNWANAVTVEAQRHMLDVEVDLHRLTADSGYFVEIDGPCLERILRELIHNACKYTPSGGCIQLLARELGERWELDIRNSIEIPSAEIAHVFEKFYRAADIRTAQVQGTGLGLSIVKELVELSEGTISLTSDGGWTTVRLSFPKQLATATA